MNFTLSPKIESTKISSHMPMINEPRLIMNSASAHQISPQQENSAYLQQPSNISLKFANNKKEQGLTEKLREYESQMMLDSKQYELKQLERAKRFAAKANDSQYLPSTHAGSLVENEGQSALQKVTGDQGGQQTAVADAAQE